MKYLTRSPFHSNALITIDCEKLVAQIHISDPSNVNPVVVSPDTPIDKDNIAAVNTWSFKSLRDILLSFTSPTKVCIASNDEWLIAAVFRATGDSEISMEVNEEDGVLLDQIEIACNERGHSIVACAYGDIPTAVSQWDSVRGGFCIG